jgi:hypothetical protein
LSLNGFHPGPRMRFRRSFFTTTRARDIVEKGFGPVARSIIRIKPLTSFDAPLVTPSSSPQRPKFQHSSW